MSRIFLLHYLSDPSIDIFLSLLVFLYISLIRLHLYVSLNSVKANMQSNVFSTILNDS